MLGPIFEKLVQYFEAVADVAGSRAAQLRAKGWRVALREAWEARQQDLQRYGGAMVLVGFAFFMRVMLLPVLKQSSPYLTSYLAVAIAAVWFGAGPAVMVTAWTAAIGMWLLPAAARGEAAEVARLSMMLITNVTIAIVGGALRRGRADLLKEAAAARLAEEGLRKAKEAADRANESKDRFLAVLSHELRTPLSPVLAAAQMLEVDRSVSEETREQVKMIRRNVELEARLIDDLLDLTRVSRGKLELQLGTVDAHEKVRQVLHICEVEIRAKGIRVTEELQAPLHHVEADGARLQQVLWNLIRNAVKFTAMGGEVAVRTGNTKDGGIEVEVRDTGVGIEKERLESVFKAFEQGGREVTREFGGLGLGLAISRAVVELHRGRIEAASAGKGKGATFTVVLPGARMGAAKAKGAGDTVVGKMALAVLLVEDHADTRAVMTRLLKGMGCDVTAAGSVAEALAAVERAAFDLMISDIGLPDGTGVELMREVRGRRELRGIALSGYGMEEDVARSVTAGFSAHLTKPVNVMALEAAIRRVVGGQGIQSV